MKRGTSVTCPFMRFVIFAINTNFGAIEMSGKLTKAAYQEAINADINWVKEQANQGLLSQHIIAVLEDSISQHYAAEIKAEEIKQIYVGGLNDEFKTVDEAMN